MLSAPPAAPPPVAPPHIVIVGAGFGGLHAARSLAGRPVRVTIVDRHNYHSFQPLFYQVATAGLEPDAIAHAVRAVLRRAKNVDFRLGEVTGIDTAARALRFADGPPLAYDALIVAPGASTAYYGVEGAREHGWGLKSLADAVRLRAHVLGRFERYSLLGEGAGEGALTFVIVGGGATGVEMAGAFHELFRMALRHDYKTFDPSRAARIVLLEREDALLAGYPDRLRAYARRVLERRNVEVRTGAAVARVEADGVVLASGERIAAGTLVWAAGVEASPLVALLPGEKGPGGRAHVRPDLSLAADAGVFVIGDAAFVEGSGTLPQLAPVAIQQGKHAARNALRAVRGETLEPFRYRDLGSMATIGRNAAVAMLFGRVPLTGFPAWLAWVFVHLMQLVGFRNRLLVFVNWVHSYFTYDRGARLILGDGAAEGLRGPLDAPVPGRLHVRTAETL